MSYYLLCLAFCERTYVTLLCELLIYNVVEDFFVLIYGWVIRWGEGLGYGWYVSLKTVCKSFDEVGVSGYQTGSCEEILPCVHLIWRYYRSEALPWGISGRRGRCCRNQSMHAWRCCGGANSPVASASRDTRCHQRGR